MKKSPMPPDFVNHEAVEATAAAWLARRDNEKAWTSRDEAALEAWLNEHTAHEVAWLRLQYAWARADRLAPLREELTKPEATEELVVSQPPAIPWWKARGVLMALTLCGVLLVGAEVAWQAAGEHRGEERFATAVGARQSITLRDGSKVTLNTRTQARAQVTKTERTFWLDSGEAFFEVQHDPAHPFVINAGKDRITVLGTKFSVRHEDGQTRVTVLEGKVRLEQAASTARLEAPTASATVLVKNDNAVAQSGGVLVATLTPVQTLHELSWREGRLEFDNLSLIEMAAEFNRYNRRQLVIHGNAANIRLSGRFETYNVDGFVRLIQSGFDVDVREEGDTIHLSSR